MKKIFLIAFFGISALFADAQQWAGSTTTSDTIYRYGMTRILPTQNIKPYLDITNSEIRMSSSYNGQYPGNTMFLNTNGLSFDRLVPAARNSTFIGYGEFNFHCDSDHSGKDFTLLSNGNLTTQGQISSTDTIFAKNFTANTSINASTAYLSYISGNNGTFSNKVTATNIVVNNTSVPTSFNFGVTGKSYFSDFVGIGTTNLTATSGYKLAVDGGILCEEVKVIANVPSADYVFEKGYNLRSLGEVEAYVNENKHLPDVPSAKEFKENGYKMGDMDNLLLQKIEELTLYIIEQQKQIDELKHKLNE